MIPEKIESSKRTNVHLLNTTVVVLIYIFFPESQKNDTME